MGLAGKIKSEAVTQQQHQQYGAQSPSQQAQTQHQQYGAQPPPQQAQPQHQQYGAQPPPQQAQTQHQQYGAQSPSQQAQPQHQQYGAQPPPQQAQTQHQQYGAQPPPYVQNFTTPTQPTSTRHLSDDVITTKLQRIISENRLESFFDATRFQEIVRRVSSVNFDDIAARWKISKELAYDLAPLALYDIVFYCDDSGSMAFEEDGERIEDLKFILSKVSDVVTKFDEDGLVVRFMNSNVNGDGIHNSAEVNSLVSQVNFSGMTPLGTNFDKKVIQPLVLGQAGSNTMMKPILAIIITDGEPSGESRGKISSVISRAKETLCHTRFGPGALAVQIAQVGKDIGTQQFLATLDKDPVIGGMIDCTSYFELEAEEFSRKGVTLTPELWLLKMCVGAIDRQYDEAD